jgi:hypothetical protein
MDNNIARWLIEGSFYDGFGEIQNGLYKLYDLFGPGYKFKRWCTYIGTGNNKPTITLREFEFYWKFPNTVFLNIFRHPNKDCDLGYMTVYRIHYNKEYKPNLDTEFCCIVEIQGEYFYDPPGRENTFAYFDDNSRAAKEIKKSWKKVECKL